MAQQVALPPEPPVVAWDPARGVFLIDSDRPDWAAARRRYEALALEPRPIVQVPRRRLVDQLRRARRQASYALDILLGRRR